jgi:hypothetical protein
MASAFRMSSSEQLQGAGSRTGCVSFGLRWSISLAAPGRVCCYAAKGVPLVVNSTFPTHFARTPLISRGGAECAGKATGLDPDDPRGDADAERHAGHARCASRSSVPLRANASDLLRAFRSSLRRSDLNTFFVTAAGSRTLSRRDSRLLAQGRHRDQRRRQRLSAGVEVAALAECRQAWLRRKSRVRRAATKNPLQHQRVR